MIINKLLIQCFQKHTKLELNFCDSINVITGLTDSGKSAIFRSLEWVFNLSNISPDDFRQEGSKETSVKIWLDNSFQIERIRSNSINRYILSKEGCEDKIFDSFGKTIPEEIANVIDVSTLDIDNDHVNLNFANQDQLNFLLDSTYSDTFKSKLFNKLTGNELLDKLFKELNKESLRISRETKTTEDLLQEQEEQLAEYSIHYKQLKSKLNSVSEQYELLKEDIKIYECLTDLSEKIKINKESTEFVTFKIAQIKTVSKDKIKELKNQAEELKALNDKFHELESVNESLETTNKQLCNIKVTNVTFEDLKTTNTTIQELQEFKKKLDIQNQANEQITKQIEETKGMYEKVEKELKELWEKCKICPLCHTELK